MKSFVIALFLTLCFMGSTGKLMADEYVLLLASYGEKVSMANFSSKGFNNVSVRFENGVLYKYYKTGYNNESLANEDMAKAISAGFPYARVINETERERKCWAVCHDGETIPMDEALKVRNLFFDFDRFHLRNESRQELETLKRILEQNPNFSVEVHAHTDAKGSLEYNTALAKKRQNSVVDYLLKLGIPISKIEKFSHGEENPIAKNELADGQDTERGRQLNRRVEIVVKDNGTRIPNLVEEIPIPAELKL